MVSEITRRRALKAIGAGTITKDNGYAWAAGTSMASPHVAGVAALAWEESGTDGPITDVRDKVRSTLNSTADDLGHSACMQGSGLVDAEWS